MLLLRNGNVLQGEITQAGDFFIVILGKTSEIRVPAKDVEAQVASLDEAYQLKRHGLFGRGAAPHLDLAEWCLRQGLHGGCREQLALARKIEAENPRTADLERRLELATAPRPTARPKQEPVTPTTASAQQIEAAIKTVPKASIEKFAAVIQPLLTNRCGANQCHGANSKADFQLLRPPGGQAATQRFTQRNLYAVLQKLDASNPEASPLLVEAQRRHGNALTAPLDKQTQKQFEELKAWVVGAVALPAESAPATIPADDAATLSQSVSQTAGPLATVPAPATPPAAGDRFVPRDPFDPEIFNRRFRAKKAAATPARPE
jgi:hypothetical protein